MSLEKESWEDFDAETLFNESPQIHVDRLLKIDEKEMTKVDSPENQLEEGMIDMEGLESDSSDSREVNADKEIDRRTEELSEDSESDDNESERIPPESESSEKFEEGAENPIQKESEGIEEVAEATFKTSEDVHGGDEATKDIEDSPNAADDGQNLENEGAESGESGEEGEGPEGNSSNSEEDGQDFKDSDNNSAQSANGKSNDLPEEDWEKEAGYSALTLQLENNLKEFEAKCRDEKGHRTSLPAYDFDRKDSPVELETAFQKGRELIRKMAAEEDVSTRKSGWKRWDAKTLCRNVASFKHSKIPSSRFERPQEADIKILLDISGSCQEQAEMFMAIAAGAIGNGVEIYVGYNGTCRASAMQVPKRLPNSYKQARKWVQSEMERVSGWDNQKTIGEWTFPEFVEETKPKTLIIFGDWDGIDQYQEIASHHHSAKLFWFCNQGYGRRKTNADTIPDYWNRRNYFPGIYAPQDLVQALRKIR